MSAPMSFEEWRQSYMAANNGLTPSVNEEVAFDMGEQARQPEIDALKAELERERMCHAGCGVVAMANTEDALAKAMDMSPKYLSAAIRDVARAVRAEIDLRKENEALKARIAELEDKLVNMAGVAGAEAVAPTEAHGEPVAWRWPYGSPRADGSQAYEVHSHDAAVIMGLPCGEPLYLRPAVALSADTDTEILDAVQTLEAIDTENMSESDSRYLSLACKQIRSAIEAATKGAKA